MVGRSMRSTVQYLVSKKYIYQGMMVRATGHIHVATCSVPRSCIIGPKHEGRDVISSLLPVRVENPAIIIAFLFPIFGKHYLFHLCRRRKLLAARWVQARWVLLNSEPTILRPPPGFYSVGGTFTAALRPASYKPCCYLAHHARLQEEEISTPRLRSWRNLSVLLI